MAQPTPGTEPASFEARLYEPLFKSANPADLGDAWLDDFNHESLTVIPHALAPPRLANTLVGDRSHARGLLTCFSSDALCLFYWWHNLLIDCHGVREARQARLPCSCPHAAATSAVAGRASCVACCTVRVRNAVLLRCKWTAGFCRLSTCAPAADPDTEIMSTAVMSGFSWSG